MPACACPPECPARRQIVVRYEPFLAAIVPSSEPTVTVAFTNDLQLFALDDGQLVRILCGVRIQCRALECLARGLLSWHADLSSGRIICAPVHLSWVFPTVRNLFDLLTQELANSSSSTSNLLRKFSSIAVVRLKWPTSNQLCPNFLCAKPARFVHLQESGTGSSRI